MRYLRVVFVVLVCMPLLTPAVSYAAMSLQEFLNLEENAVNKQSGSPVVNMYLLAVLDSYGLANAMLEEDRQKLLFCQPSNLALGLMNLRQLINDRIQKYRTVMGDEDWDAYSRSVSVGAESLFSLKETFPCGK